MKGFLGQVGRFLVGAMVVIVGIFAVLLLAVGLSWLVENGISEPTQKTLGNVMEWVYVAFLVLLLIGAAWAIGDSIVEKIQDRRRAVKWAKENGFSGKNVKVYRG